MWIELQNRTPLSFSFLKFVFVPLLWQRTVYLRKKKSIINKLLVISTSAARLLTENHIPLLRPRFTGLLYVLGLIFKFSCLLLKLLMDHNLLILYC